MNWLFWVVAALIAGHVIDGLHRGFIKKSVSAVSLIVTLVLVTYLTPEITTFIQKYTSLHESLQEKCSEIFLDDEPLGARCWPPFEWEIPSHLQGEKQQILHRK